MYKRILVATGGSPWSYTAVTYAIALAAYTGAELRTLTVLTSAVTSYATPDVLSSSNKVAIADLCHQRRCEAAQRWHDRRHLLTL